MQNSRGFKNTSLFTRFCWIIFIYFLINLKLITQWQHVFCPIKKKFWKKTHLLSASTTGWDIQSSFSKPWINELKNRAITMLEKLQGKSLLVLKWPSQNLNPSEHLLRSTKKTLPIQSDDAWRCRLARMNWINHPNPGWRDLTKTTQSWN